MFINGIHCLKIQKDIKTIKALLFQHSLRLKLYFPGKVTKFCCVKKHQLKFIYKNIFLMLKKPPQNILWY